MRLNRTVWTTGLAMVAALSGCDRPTTAANGDGTSAVLAENNAIVGTAAPADDDALAPEALTPEPHQQAVEEVTRPTVPGAAPNIRFESLLHDFGEVWDIEEQKASFKFTNTGNAPLIISNVKPSCGCTTTTLEKMHFEPGEGDAIDLVFKPKGFGAQKKSIRVMTNDPDQPVVTLMIAAEITPFVKVDPGAYLRYGNIKLGEPHTKSVTLRSSDPKLEVVKIRAGQGISVSPVRKVAPTNDPSGSRGAASTFTFDVTLDPNMPWGQLRERLEIQTKGRTRPDTEIIDHPVTITLLGFLYNEVVVEPTLFAVSVVPPGDTFENRIRMWRPSGESFRILDMKVLRSSLPGVTVEAVPTLGDPDDPTIGSAYNLVLRGDSGDFNNHRISGLVQVETDLPGDEAKMTFQFAGMIRDPGAR